jgi:hypothetical protein
MSPIDQPKKAGATFTWVLGAFAFFAVLFLFIQAFNDSKAGFDPRAQERSDNTAEILKAQGENIAKLGLNDAVIKEKVFQDTLDMFAAKKPGTSTQVVPGSPTQLKQAAAAAVPAPAAAPAPTAAVSPPVAPTPVAPAAVPTPAPAVSAPVAPAAPAPAPTVPPSAPPSPAPVATAAPAPAPAAPASPK